MPCGSPSGAERDRRGLLARRAGARRRRRPGPRLADRIEWRHEDLSGRRAGRFDLVTAHYLRHLVRLPGMFRRLARRGGAGRALLVVNSSMTLGPVAPRARPRRALHRGGRRVAARPGGVARRRHGDPGPRPGGRLADGEPRAGHRAHGATPVRSAPVAAGGTSGEPSGPGAVDLGPCSARPRSPSVAQRRGGDGGV